MAVEQEEKVVRVEVGPVVVEDWTPLAAPARVAFSVMVAIVDAAETEVMAGREVPEEQVETQEAYPSRLRYLLYLSRCHPLHLTRGFKQ